MNFEMDDGPIRFVSQRRWSYVRIQGDDDDDNDPILEKERLKEDLNKYFGNHNYRWKNLKYLPFGLLLDMNKLIFIIAGIYYFGIDRYSVANYYTHTKISFDNIFIKNWDPSREVFAYPAGEGHLAIYDIESFYQYFDYFAQSYRNLNGKAMKMSNLEDKINVLIKSFEKNDFDKYTFSRESLKLDPGRRMLENITIPWNDLEWIQVHFDLTSSTKRNFNNRRERMKNYEQCFEWNLRIIFDNSADDGQVLIKLDVDAKHVGYCYDLVARNFDLQTNFLPMAIIIITILCLLNSIRDLSKGFTLAHRAEKYLEMNHGWKFSSKEKLSFLNGWDLMNLLSSILIIAGCFTILTIERNNRHDMYIWDYTALLLGLGFFLTVMGMFRYLESFEEYNIIFQTFLESAPRFFQFIMTAIGIYFGFTFMAWIILGPYHGKFKNIMKTSECLFSLINGDDMFATFSSISDFASPLIVMVARIFIYGFVCIFIYIILSITIAIMTNTYEAIVNRLREPTAIQDRILRFAMDSSFNPNLFTQNSLHP